MIWVKFVKKLIKILSSEISPGQIAGGFALGSIIGFTPAFSLHNAVILFLIFLLQVNIASAFFGIAVFSLVGLLTDPFAHKIGYYLLITNTGLTSFWTYLYNMPLVPFTRFYNTVVLGSLIISIVLFMPIFISFKYFVIFYRNNLQSKVVNWKIVQWLKLTKVYSIYTKYN